MIIKKLLTPQGMLGLPPGLIDLVADLQAALTPFLSPNPLQSFQEFKPYNAERGILDRQNNPALYTETASRLLDFHLFNTPQLIHEFFNAYENTSYWTTLVNAGIKLNSQMEKMVDPGLHYLDPLHFIPHLLNSNSVSTDKLYHKMLIFKWFLTKMSAYGLKQRELALEDYSKAELPYGALALLQNYIHDDPRFGDSDLKNWENIPWTLKHAINHIARKPHQRLATLNQRTEAYALQQGLPHLSIEEIEESYVKPQRIKMAEALEAQAKVAPKSESTQVHQHKERHKLEALIKSLQSQHCSLDAQLKMLGEQEMRNKV